MAEDNKQIDFNEALRRIANTPKDLIEPLVKPVTDLNNKKKTAPQKKGAVKVS